MYSLFNFQLSLSKPSEIVLKKVNFRSSGIYRCEITSSKYEITEKYQQMTVIGTQPHSLYRIHHQYISELPHKAPTISTDLNIKEYEVGDLLELNCSSEPSHPASHLTWEVNKQQVPEDNYIFRETIHNGKKLYVTRIGMRIRLTKDHFHWGKLKVTRDSIYQQQALPPPPARWPVWPRSKLYSGRKELRTSLLRTRRPTTKCWSLWRDTG